jgi:L-seryl-tRNA(Ser) seleniumtransferase
MQATVGGGALPGESLPSVGLRLRAGSASRLLAALRRGEPCVIGRIEDGAVVVDLRTVAPDQDAGLTTALQQALA